jgi:pimeloyl-ACP methyl ester carboxylesterase
MTGPSGDQGSGPIGFEPFTIAVDAKILDDLTDRIARTRWPAASPYPRWDDGADLDYLRALLESWAAFDWRGVESRLNALPHYRANIDGTRIHFIHQRGAGPAPFPLILTHGWPSSFLEHLEVLPLLTDPASHGGDPEDAFDVVVASLPGFGYSDPLPVPNLETTVADLWCGLMRALGYQRFGAHGSDAGSGVTIALGRRHPEHLAGIHLSAFYLYPPKEPWPAAVRTFLDAQAAERAGSVGYSRIQSTRPQTVAYGLTDSPAALAAWIIDVFRAFSDCGGDLETRFSREQILTNLTLYWATSTISTSIRGYYDFATFAAPVDPDDSVHVPSGFAVFADDYRGGTRPPREIADGSFNVQRWEVMPRGGHFAALEEPELLVHELREFFRPLRAAGTVESTGTLQ